MIFDDETVDNYMRMIGSDNPNDLRTIIRSLLLDLKALEKKIDNNFHILNNAKKDYDDRLF